MPIDRGPGDPLNIEAAYKDRDAADAGERGGSAFLAADSTREEEKEIVGVGS